MDIPTAIIESDAQSICGYHRPFISLSTHLIRMKGFDGLPVWLTEIYHAVYIVKYYYVH